MSRVPSTPLHPPFPPVIFPTLGEDPDRDAKAKAVEILGEVADANGMADLKVSV